MTTHERVPTYVLVLNALAFVDNRICPLHTLWLHLFTLLLIIWVVCVTGAFACVALGLRFERSTRTGRMRMIIPH